MSLAALQDQNYRRLLGRCGVAPNFAVILLGVFFKKSLLQ
jgi:hypothetical protein